MDASKLNGPEFARLREYVKEFKIKVTIFDKNDKIIREEVMDYGNQDDRKWLGKLSWWGWSNGHVVETSEFKEG